MHNKSFTYSSAAVRKNNAIANQSGKSKLIQKKGSLLEEELPVQGRFTNIIQKKGILDEEVLPTQAKFTMPIQKAGGGDDDEEPLQMKTNDTGLPNHLKTGVEALSGFSMDDVKVHYNSHKPAQLQALAYAQGSDIHIAPGQERHLPHEAWHVAQQKQGRVKPTLQMKEGVNINDDAGLEKEADIMGAKALQTKKKFSDKPIVLAKRKEQIQLRKPISGNNSYQFKNSRTPNWVRFYQATPEIHAAGIGNLIAHVENGEGAAGAQQGVHVMPNDNPPPNITVVQEENVGTNTIGKILWHFTDNPGGNGTLGQPIPVKNSTVFPTKFCNPVAGITGVRALMKAAVSGGAHLANLSAAMGLTGKIVYAQPSVYPTTASLRVQGDQFANGGMHYRVI